MRTTNPFREQNKRVLAEFIGAHAFGALVTIERGTPLASHLRFPYSRDARTLRAHVARGDRSGNTSPRTLKSS